MVTLWSWAGGAKPFRPMLLQQSMCCGFAGDPGYEASIDSDALPPGSPVEAGGGCAAPAALVGADIPSDCLSLLAGASAGELSLHHLELGPTGYEMRSCNISRQTWAVKPCMYCSLPIIYRKRVVLTHAPPSNLFQIKITFLS